MFSLRLKTQPAALAASTLALLAACGDNGKPVTDAAAVQEGPAVLAVERTFGPEGRTYFLSVLPDAPTANLDHGNATEISGSADVEVYEGAIYVRTREDSVITRYRVSNDLKLVKDGEVSFANKGLATERYHSAFLTPDRAFLLDGHEARLIEWNPTTMKLSTQADIAVSFMDKAEVPNSIVFGVPARVGNRVVTPLYWQNFDTGIMYAGTGAAIVPDATNPALPVLAEDTRIGGAFRAIGNAAGDVYVVGYVGGDTRAFGTIVGGAAPHSGVLKIAAGATEFDPDYFIDVEAITGSTGIANVHVLDDKHILVQILDPATPFPTTEDGYLNSTDFVWKMIDTTTKTATDVPELARGGRANGGSHIVDGKLYIQYRDDAGNAIVKRIDADGSFHDAFTVQSGDLWHLERIR